MSELFSMVWIPLLIYVIIMVIVVGSGLFMATITPAKTKSTIHHALLQFSTLASLILFVFVTVAITQLLS